MHRWRQFLPDGFVIAMLMAVGLAFAFPWLGSSEGPLPLKQITNWGVALVFFLHGANLARDVLVRGLAHWRLHLFVQASTFAMFPLIGLAILGLGRALAVPADLLLGFFYLCALPSTVSSSVAMTALARGNVPAAVFNASLSGLIGMIVTPALIGLVGDGMVAGMPSVGAAIGDIAQTLLLPFALGQMSRLLIGDFVTRNKAIVGKVDRGVIVLIVFTAFAESTAAGVWAKFGAGLLALTLVVTALILFVALSITVTCARLMGLTRADEVTAVFCGSKKSLANGAPMAGILFAGHPSLGLIMLPIMLYHQLQLIVCSVLARRYADASEAEAATAQADPVSA